MYESSCSYQSALDLKRVSAACPPAVPAIKSEDCMSAGLSGTAGDWAAGCAYRFACNSSTFEQLKQSVEKAKAALQDRGSYLAASSAFSDLAATAATSPFAPPPRNNATSNAAAHDPLQDATRRDDANASAISSVSDKRTHRRSQLDILLSILLTAGTGHNETTSQQLLWQQPGSSAEGGKEGGGNKATRSAIRLPAPLVHLLPPPIPTPVMTSHRRAGERKLSTRE
ncbi:hypothetical protein C0J52_28162 [Blattella germanica]|nr:hypothetical protein C0J52_28162 [Blattella germanica]